MNTAKTLILIGLVAFGLGCGYSKPATAGQTSTPAITQLNPTSATAGGADFQLEVDGTSFASKAVINFNGTAQVTTFTSSSKLTATIPAAAIANTGTVPVTVTNPGTSGIYGTPPVTSAPSNFTIN